MPIRRCLFIDHMIIEFIIRLLKICTFSISDTDIALKYLSYHFWRAHTFVLRVNLKLNPSAHGVHYV